MDIIQKKREVINELVRKYEGDKLKAIDFISSDVLFENTGYGYTFALSKEILSKLDFTGKFKVFYKCINSTNINKFCH